MQLLCLGVNHHTAPLAVRERLAYTPSALDGVFRHYGGGDPQRRRGRQLAVLATCNRVEWYAVAPTEQGPHQADPFTDLLDAFVRFQDGPPAALAPHLYRLTGVEAARHLCRVAAGLDSMVLGEPQILGQVAASLDLARQHQAAGPMLEALFQTALRTGRRARHETRLNQKPASISSVAVRLAQQVAETLDRCRVVVVGGGKIGTLALQLLRAQTACELVLVNRTLEAAEQPARAWGAAVYGLEDLPAVLADADLVITSTAAPEPILTTALVEDALRQRPDRPLTVIDVAVPRDVEPSVRTVPNVRLFDLDDLQSQAEEVVAERRRELPFVEEIIEEEVLAFELWRRGADVRPLIADLRHKAEFIRQQEVQRTMRQLPELDPVIRRHIERLSHALVNKLLHEPTTRLRSAARSGEAAESVETVRRLFALSAHEAHAA